MPNKGYNKSNIVIVIVQNSVTIGVLKKMRKREIAEKIYEQYAGIDSVFRVLLNLVYKKRSEKKAIAKKASTNYMSIAKNHYIMYNYLKDKGLLEDCEEYSKEILEELKGVFEYKASKVK